MRHDDETQPIPLPPATRSFSVLRPANWPGPTSPTAAWSRLKVRAVVVAVAFVGAVMWEPVVIAWHWLEPFLAVVAWALIVYGGAVTGMFG